MTDQKGVPNLYATKCKECGTNITNGEKHLVNLEPPRSNKKRFGFVCTDCWYHKFDKDNNRK